MKLLQAQLSLNSAQSKLGYFYKGQCEECINLYTDFVLWENVRLKPHRHFSKGTRFEPMQPTTLFIVL